MKNVLFFVMTCVLFLAMSVSLNADSSLNNQPHVVLANDYGNYWYCVDYINDIDALERDIEVYQSEINHLNGKISSLEQQIEEDEKNDNITFLVILIIGGWIAYKSVAK
jgi:peptidoglycan hydrolase CwlO-like protein